MFGAYNKEEGPSLYMIEPSGVSWVGYFLCCACFVECRYLLLLFTSIVCYCPFRDTLAVLLAKGSKRPKQR